METSDLSIELEFTPNPETLKYVVNRTLLPAGVANFTSPESAHGKSLLAEDLFKISEITAVMIGKDFVTITVKNQDQLYSLNDTIMQKLKSFFASDQKIVEAQEPKAATPLTEIERKIVEILDTEIRPAVAMDGGDISFERFEDGFVYLRMQGSCSGCPSSMMTLKMGVETRLRQAIPEVQEVIPV